MMSRIFIIHKKHLLFIGTAIIVVLFSVFYFNSEKALPANTAITGERTIHMVTGEFKALLPDGKEIEAYRWDPGTIFVNQGEEIKLVIYGVNGASHPFIIEGLNIKDEVKKGEETIISFKAEKEGIYRIICIAHPD